MLDCCSPELGPGLIEQAYSRAVGYELADRGITFRREQRVPITYRGRHLYMHRLDLVVANEIVLELKAVDRLHPVHHAQLISALRAATMIGLLINFNVP